MEARLLTEDPPADLLRDAQSVYAAAFGQPPYGEGPVEAAAFAERVRRYAREREGLRLVVVHDDGPAGLGLAVLARPGDWWRDRAAELLAPEQRDRWLGDCCLEVVHLAVHPRAQGRGLGRLLHDLLIAGTPAPTGVLACSTAAAPAQRLYTGRGWHVLTDGLGAGGEASVLMARQL